jgi:queuosine precursor transporter
MFDIMISQHAVRNHPALSKLGGTTMSNELLWFLFAIANFSLFLLAYRLFGKTGIFVWIGVATVLANIQVTKSVTLFGFEATMGNIMYGTIFLATDALNEVYSNKAAKRAVWLGFFILIAATVIMQIALVFEPNAYDFGQNALETIFGFFPRLVLASLTAFLVSQFFDVYIFQKIRAKLPSDKHLWIRNNGSTILSQLIDTAIFVPIAFVGVLPADVIFGWTGIFISTYVIKVIVAMLDTPFLYLLKKIKPLDN